MFKHFLPKITKLIFIIFTVFVAIIPYSIVSALGCEELQLGYISKVTQIIDGDSVILQNGTSVRLIGIQAPKLALGRKGFTDWPLASEAKAALSAIALNKKVRLDFGDEQSDRHGRTLAHLFVINNDNSEIWVQKYMLENGMARTYSFADNRLCVNDLLKYEDQARINNKGIWNNEYYNIRLAEKPNRLLKFDNRYELVEGRVISVKKVGPIIYINFGKNYRTDFTIVIERYGQKIFKKAKFSPDDYQDAFIRVRGWVEIKNGPFIEVTHPEQIEVLATR